MSYTVPETLDKDKVFLIRKSELGKRLDTEYYIPSLVKLEKKVLAKNPKKLRDYTLSLSSGATPKTTDSEKYYADKENGIPFLRVQNLSPTGILEFDDCKYINNETHNRILRRSQVGPNDLLVKITGVGRMAIASVAPENFEGNINQHIVVIKTKDKETSETIAAFLNSDIGEKLASRRSTGGTRPALDYPALLSIPIIYDKKNLEITQKVVKQKKQNEAAAEKLLESIDDYLMKELEITLPPLLENNLKNRVFTSSINEVSGNRFDPFYHQEKFRENVQAIMKGKYLVEPLREIIAGNLTKGVLPKLEEKNGNNPVVQINCINSDGTIELKNVLIAKDIFSKEQKLIRGDVLVVITGATIGKIAQWNYEGDFYLGGDIIKFQTNALADNTFIFHLLRCMPIQIELKRNITGATNGHLAPEDLKHLPIPIPPITKQKEIAEHISLIRKQVQQLKERSKEALKAASSEIEKLILG